MLKDTRNALGRNPGPEISNALPDDELPVKPIFSMGRDAEPATGWKLTHDPFPGWETVPVW